MKSARASDAIRSMTGYAQAHAEQDGWLLRVSLRSVNHRFLDVRVRLPEGFDAFEPQIRQRLRDRLRRGHVDVTLHVEATGATPVHVHREIAGSYLRAVEDLRREFFRRLHDPFVARFRAYLERRIADGAFRPVNIEVTASICFRMVMSYVMTQHVLDVAPVRHSDDEYLGEMVTLVLRGLTARGPALHDASGTSKEE